LHRGQEVDYPSMRENRMQHGRIISFTFDGGLR
jgi:hypothetical protein